MRKMLAGFLIVVILGFGAIVTVSVVDTAPTPDVVAINDAVRTAMDSGDSAEVVQILTEQLLDEYNAMTVNLQARDQRFLAAMCTYAALVVAAGLGLYLYCESSVLKPFRKLQRFAREVAIGNLDLPLEMDRGGRFGAFTESFDLMRDELKTARINERAADRSKKELVAALSHDIKTPIASIKAAMDVMSLTANDQQKLQLERVSAKADQIDTLITDMFHTTLEELQALPVTAVEVSTTTLPKLIEYSDYAKRVRPFQLPGCIVMADLIRLQQVFDNIIGNSYKYADTDIDIQARIDGSFLDTAVSDFGPGVQPEELPFITTKFYRGGNSNQTSGYGMGLFIAKDLVTRMSGNLDCENSSDGFCVHIRLRLAD